MNLANRLQCLLHRIITVVNQNIRFVSSAWSIANSATETSLTSTSPNSATAKWNNANSASSRNGVNGKYYFEVLITKYVVGDAQAVRIGVGNLVDRGYLLSSRGGKFQNGSLSSYVNGSTGELNTHLWGLGDVIGVSIQPSATSGSFDIRYYINGSDKGIAFTLSSRELYPYFEGYRASKNSEIGLKIQDVKYLPLGFQIW